MILTPRQLDVLSALRNFKALHGYSPTFQELADQLGVSKVTIHEMIGCLERRGAIRRDRYKPRSLEIITAVLPDEERASKMPILGTLYAGSPIQTMDEREAIDLKAMFDHEGRYVVLASSDMPEFQISNGDYIVVRRCRKSGHGKLVLADDDKGSLILRRMNGQPLNVQAEVVGLMRNLQ